MNPLVLFDYVYYCIAKLYAKVFNIEEVKALAGLSILSIFQLINGLTLLVLFGPLEKVVKEPIIIYIVGYLFILSLNFIRYKKVVVYSDLSVKWDNENRKTKILKIACVVGYCTLSLFLGIFINDLLNGRV